MSVVTGAARTRQPGIARRSGGSRRPLLLLSVTVALAALFAVLVAPAGAAQAAAYRYWGYYQLTDGKWAFAQKGPDAIKPKDGSIEGWRYAISGDNPKDAPRTPRAKPSFDDICGTTKAVDGKKRIGIVIDAGRKADGSGGTPPKPVAECALVDEAAHSDEALAEVADVRAQKKLVCAINAYPAKGCGDEVGKVPAAAKAPDKAVTIAPAQAGPTATPGATTTSTKGGASDADQSSAAKKSTQDSGSSAGTVVGVVVVILVVIAVALVALRRRKQV